jgi:hypothetical protein
MAMRPSSYSFNFLVYWVSDAATPLHHNYLFGTYSFIEQVYKKNLGFILILTKLDKIEINFCKD